MMRRLLSVPALLALLACSGKPQFTAELRPGQNLDAIRTMAFDPRQVAWVTEGQRPVQAESLKRLVQEALEARGWRLVEPEAADVWVDVIATRPNRGGEFRGSGNEGTGGHGGGRSGGGMRGGQGMGHDRGAGAHAAPSVGEGAPSQRGMAFEGFDPGGELTFTVQLLTRENIQTVWTGSVHLPPQKKGEMPDRRASMRDVVHQLLEPLPVGHVAEAN